MLQQTFKGLIRNNLLLQSKDTTFINLVYFSEMDKPWYKCTQGCTNGQNWHEWTKLTETDKIWHDWTKLV